MRRMAAKERNRTKRDIEERGKREKAVQLLKSGKSGAQVVRIGIVSRSNAYRLCNALKKNDSELQNLLHSEQNRSGRRKIIGQAESSLIKSKMKEAASRGFASDMDDLRDAMFQIASDGREAFNTTSELPY